MSPAMILSTDNDQPQAIVPGRRPGLLVATAQSRLRWALALRLTGRGFEVWTAMNGIGALDAYLAHSSEIDVLLLDAGLSDLPGPAFYRRLHTHFPGTPCCFLVESRQASLAREVQRMGATVIARPFSFRILVQTLWDLVLIDTNLEA
jgi:DNA-binding response OmpR family regulator